MQKRSLVYRLGRSGGLPVLSRLFLNARGAGLIAWCWICHLHAFAQPGDNLPTRPPLQEPRVRTFDLQHVALDLQFDFTQQQAYGTATLTLSPLVATNQIALDAGFLNIQSVSTAQGTPLTFEYDGSDRDNGLVVQLGRTCAAGATLDLRITYRTTHHNDSDPNNLWGSYGQGLRFFSPTATEPRKRRQIWSMGEPSGNRYWFPGFDAPGDAHTSELRATVPAPFQVFANGALASTRNNTDGTRTFHWQDHTPHFTHATALVVGEYVDVPQNVDGVALHSWAYPDEVAATQATVVRLPEMLRFFKDLTGHAYPYLAYNQVFVQDFPWGGGHHPGTSTISENMVDDFGTHADFFYLWDGVEAQDLAAQWFGHLLQPADWSEVWLTQSLALYLDCLFSEHRNGHDEMQLWNRQFQLTTSLGDWQAGIRRPLVTRHYTQATDLTQGNFGLRGALVLHLLRQHLGEEKWREALRHFVANYAGKAVKTEDFRRSVEAVAGQSYEWFFEQWVYRMGHPVLEVAKNYDATRRELTLHIRQTQQHDSTSAYPQTAFFQGQMTVEIDNRLETIWLKAQPENVFVFKNATAPRLVNVDVGSAWIKELKQDKTPDEWLYQFEHSRDVLGRREAMLQLARIYRLEGTPAGEKARIAAAFRTVIVGKAYWRLRYSALLTLQGLVATQPLDEVTEATLLSVIQHETAWNRAAAIAFLGTSKDARHADLYQRYLRDSSDRVVNAAAVALGKSRSPAAFAALVALKDRPSWKNQSLISALNGLKELGDPRGAELALWALRDSAAGARWTLATPVWDYRIAAAETLVALGQGSAGYPVVLERFSRSLADNDLNDIFSNVLLLSTLGDPRGLAIFEPLRAKFSNNPAALQALDGYEAQLKAAEAAGK